jgi:hypothetical protein
MDLWKPADARAFGNAAHNFAPRRFSDANFDSSSGMHIREKMANRERGLCFPLIWINVSSEVNGVLNAQNVSRRTRMILPRAVKATSLILWFFVLTPSAVMAQNQQAPGAAPPSQSAPTAASPAQPGPPAASQTQPPPAATPQPAPAASPQAQTAAPTAKLLKPEELAALVAPIALYPDNLLSLVLMASTYPVEVVRRSLGNGKQEAEGRAAEGGG